jgi:hypothetical protein
MIFGESSSVQNRAGQQLAGSGVMFDCTLRFLPTGEAMHVYEVRPRKDYRGAPI